jgi:hypothetical protein
MNRRNVPPVFSHLLEDIKLARILIHRWVESQRTFEARAYLSTIVLLGSILQSVLLAKIEQNPDQANRAKSAPRGRHGKGLPFADWPLEVLIAVAHDCGWLGMNADRFPLALRDYRRLVDPREQRSTGISPDAETCEVAWEAVGAAMDDLTK